MPSGQPENGQRDLFHVTTDRNALLSTGAFHDALSMSKLGGPERLVWGFSSPSAAQEALWHLKSLQEASRGLPEDLTDLGGIQNWLSENDPEAHVAMNALGFAQDPRAVVDPGIVRVGIMGGQPGSFADVASGQASVYDAASEPWANFAATANPHNLAAHSMAFDPIAPGVSYTMSGPDVMLSDSYNELEHNLRVHLAVDRSQPIYADASAYKTSVAQKIHGALGGGPAAWLGQAKRALGSLGHHEDPIDLTLPTKSPGPWYHGTTYRKPIDTLKPGARHRMSTVSPNGVIYVSTDPEMANEFASHIGDSTKDVGDRGQVFELQAHTRNPWDYQNKDHVNALVSSLSDSELFHSTGIPANLARGREAMRDLIAGGDWENIEPYSDRIKAMGHDGFFLQENGTRNLGVFNSNQLKVPWNLHPTSDPRLLMSEELVTEGFPFGSSGFYRPASSPIPQVQFAFGVNGTEANLPPILEPNTEAFGNWFQASKVVNEDGSPKVLYHGTKTPGFTTFNVSAAGKATMAKDTSLGVFLTDSLPGAIQFAGPFGAIYPLYVSIQNPRVFTWQGALDPYWVLKLEIAEHARVTRDADVTTYYNCLQADVDSWKAMQASQGYDGVILQGTTTDPVLNQPVAYKDYVVPFELWQIKSATGNVGAFSTLSGDITLSEVDLADPSTLPPVQAVRGGVPFVKDSAKKWVEDQGRQFTPYDKYEPMDEPWSRRLADEQANAVHNPSDPATAASYASLGRQVESQWNHAIKNDGMTFTPWKGEGQPYANSEEMQADIANNHHLHYFPTDMGFGQGEAPNHPLLEKGDNGVVKNDMFRAVHDYYGHAKEGLQFGPRGEMNAWLQHGSMFSPDAIPALTAETHAQNSFVNYGPHLRRGDGSIPKKGEDGFLSPQDRPFAQQKAFTPSPEFSDLNHFKAKVPVVNASPKTD